MTRTAVVSYSRRSMEAARSVVEDLHSDGWSVWVDWESIGHRPDWRDFVSDAIANADLLVAVRCRHYLDSTNCKYELDQAGVHGTPVRWEIPET